VRPRLEEADEVGLRRLLQREDGVRLEPQVRLEVLRVGPGGYCRRVTSEARVA